MKKVRQYLLLVLALVVCSTIGVARAAAQESNRDQDQAQQQDRDQRRQQDRNQGEQRDRNDQANNPAYQEGMRHAQEDRANNRERRYRGQYDNDNDRAAYQ
jgi:hypothetical protein